MKKYRTKAIAALLSASVFTGAIVAYPSYADDSLTDATVQSYEDQIAAIQWKKQQALDALSNIDNEKTDTWTVIAELDNVISYNNQMKTLAEAQLDTLTKQIEQKNADITDKEMRIERQEQAFLDRMVDVYMDENSDYVELLLSADSLTDFLIKIDYVNAVFDYDNDIITDLRATKEQLEADKITLEEAGKLQQQRRNEFEEAITQTQAAYDEKYNYMQELEQDEAAWTATYNYNKQQEEQLNAELEEYLAELQRKSQSVYVGGYIGLPLPDGSYSVSSEQGWRLLYGVQDYHLGIDLASPNGTEVYAANAGTVLKSEFHYSYGNYVLIDHGGGISTLYAHMSDRLVSPGDTVAAGQLIGHVGLTGSTSGYHLHFEVRENGTVVNPRNYYDF